MRSRLTQVACASFLAITVSALAFATPLSAAPPASSLWTLDASFGSSGQRLTPLAAPLANDTGRVDIEMTDDGRTAVVSPNGFEMFRADGGKDTSYEAKTTTLLRPPFAPYGLVDEIEFQSNGKLIALNADRIVRLNLDGSLDSSFGNSGAVDVPLGGFANAPTSLAVDPLDRIVVIVSAPTSATNTNLSFVRFSPSGQLDSSFGNQGRASQTVSALADEYNRPLPLPAGRFFRGFFPDGSIIYSSANLAVLRRLSTTGQIVAGSTFIDEKSYSPHADIAWDVVGLADGSMIAGRTYVVTAQPGGPVIAGPFTELQRITPSAAGPNGAVTQIPTLGTFTMTSLTKNGRWITVAGFDPSSGQAKFARADIYGEIDREFAVPSGAAGASRCETFATNQRVVMCAGKPPASLSINRLIGESPLSDYEPIAAVRLRDTRAGYSNDVDETGVTAPGAGATTTLKILGRAGVPSTAHSVALNATVTNPKAAGFVTFWPCDKPRPNTSNVNYAVGQTTSNIVLAEPDSFGNVCIFTSAATDVVVDAIGFNRATSDYSAASGRIFDSRPGNPTSDGRSGGERLDGTAGPIPANESVAAFELRAPGQAVFFNVTVVNPRAAGWVRVFPCIGPEPKTSNVNFVAGQTAANLVAVSFPATNPRVSPPPSNFCVRASAMTDLVVDIVGRYDAQSSFHTITAARLRDTRPTESTIDALQVGPAKLLPSTTDQIMVTNRAGIPADARVVALTITVTNPSTPGWLAVYPCGSPRPSTSNINFGPGQTTANTVLAPVGSDGKVCVYTTSATDLIVDAYAWLG